MDAAASCPRTSWCWAAVTSAASSGRCSVASAQTSPSSTATRSSSAARTRRPRRRSRRPSARRGSASSSARRPRGSARGDEMVVRLQGGKELRGSHLLVAVGRRPNTDDLGLRGGGIALDARGFIVADDGYATSAPGVYAVGDVTGGPQFTHTAWDDHRILFERLVERGDARARRTARAVHRVHRSAGGRRGAHRAGRRRAGACRTRWRRCRSATSPAPSRPTSAAGTMKVLSIPRPSRSGRAGSSAPRRASSFTSSWR